MTYETYIRCPVTLSDQTFVWSSDNQLRTPRITPCKPISRISRPTVQRATSKPSRCNCRHTLRTP